jgi:hypothetical protein
MFFSSRRSTAEQRLPRRTHRIRQTLLGIRNLGAQAECPAFVAAPGIVTYSDLPLTLPPGVVPS